jgi:hypothetical protein
MKRAASKEAHFFQFLCEYKLQFSNSLELSPVGDSSKIR